MKKQYLVQTFGYWGRGKTIQEAAAQCHKAGAGKTAVCVVQVFSHPDKDPEPAITGGGMSVEYHEGSICETLLNKAKLGNLLKG